MRNKSMISCLAVAVLFTACNKPNKQADNPPIPVLGHGVTKIASVTDTTPYHNVIFNYGYNRYGNADTTFYEFLRQSAEGANFAFSEDWDVDSAAFVMNELASEWGYLDANGHLKPNAEFVNLAIARVSSAVLRDFYTTVANEDSSGAGYCQRLKVRITTLLDQHHDIDPEAPTGFGEVFTQSDLNIFGTPLPCDVAAADAIGFQEGWHYSDATGGGWDIPGSPPRSNPNHADFLQQRAMYWAMLLSASCSRAVAAEL